MTYILVLTSVGLVLWGVGVWETCRVKRHPWVSVGDDTVHESHLILPWHEAKYIQRSITVLRYKDKLLVGMRTPGETWMWVLDLDGIGLMGPWLCMQASQPDLSLTYGDAVAITVAAERYAAAERSVVDETRRT